MAYIGREPQIGNFQVCDDITVVNGQAAYTMQVDSVNVVPETANHCLVSLNGVLQKSSGTSPSFTISGSTITFASNLVTGDVIDFIHILGSVLDLGVPSDATVTNAKTNFVSTSSAAGLQIKGDGTTDGTLQLNCSQNSHGIKLKSPSHGSAQSYTLTFPTTAPSSGKALVTDGSGNLSFSSAGGLNLISTTTVSSGTANVDITSGIDSTYKSYQIQIIDLHPATDDQYVKMRFFNSSGIIDGSSYGTDPYNYSTIGYRETNTTITGYGQNSDAFLLTVQGVGNGNTESFSGIINLFNPSLATYHKLWQGNITQVNSAGAHVVGNVGGRFADPIVITGVRFFMGSGNIDSGTFKLYGIS